MNILYVYAHPNATSFNNMLKQSGLDILNNERHVVTLSDLYNEKFNAIASLDDFHLSETDRNSQYFLSQKLAYDGKALAQDIEEEIEKITLADHIIFQFPLWWFSAPAILKGWLDRVLVKGFAYDTGKVFSGGLLKGKTASLIVTTQSPEAAYQVNGVHGCTIDTFLHPIHHTFKFVGIEPIQPFIVYGAFDISDERKINIISDYSAYLKNITKK